MKGTALRNDGGITRRENYNGQSGDSELFDQMFDRNWTYSSSRLTDGLTGGLTGLYRGWQSARRRGGGRLDLGHGREPSEGRKGGGRGEKEGGSE